jgi:hypothetical protein
MRIPMLFAVAVASLSLTSCKSDDPPAQPDGQTDAPSDAPVDSNPPPPITMSFFISSTGNPNGGDFRRAGMNDTDGLAGADEFCRSLAAAANPALANKPWRAYLSTSTVNAKDRIGKGPWYNQKLVKIADTVADLIDPAKNLIGATTGYDEKGTIVPGIAAGGTNNRHDILTGTLANGMASTTTCSNWTSSAGTGVTATVGHYDRDGGGNDRTSWSSAHATQGCSAGAFVNTGGRGSIYCFVAN